MLGQVLPKLRLGFVCGLVLSVLVPVLVADRGHGAVWNSGSGFWENANSWDTLTVPDSSSEDVLISALGNVQVDLGSQRTIRSLTIDASNDRLRLEPSARLQVDGPSLINRGVIELGNFSELSLTNQVNYGSSGTIRFADDSLSTRFELNSLLTVPDSTALTIDGIAPGAGRGTIDGTGSVSVGLESELVFSDINLLYMKADITNSGAVRVSGNNSGLVVFDSITIDNASGANVLQVSDTSIAQLNDVEVNGGVLEAADTAALRVSGGAYTGVYFENAEFASGTTTLRDAATFFPGTRNNKLASGATLNIDGTTFVHGVLEAEDSTAINGSMDGLLQASELTLRGTGFLNVSAPIDVRSTLTVDRDGETRFEHLDLNLAGILVKAGTATFGPAQLELGTFRESAIATQGSAELKFLGTTLERMGIQLADGSSAQFSGTALEDVQIAGADSEFRGSIELRNSLEWDEKIALHHTADLVATDGAVILAGGELEFNSTSSVVTPRLSTQSSSDYFSVPLGRKVIMSGDYGVIGSAGETHPAMIVRGSLDVQGATIYVKGGGVIGERLIDVYGAGNLVIETMLDLNLLPDQQIGAMGTGPMGGLLRVASDSQVTMKNGSTIRGGAIETTGDGAVVVEYISSFGGFGTLEDVHNQGTVRVPAQTDLGLRGSLVNDGTIELGEGATSSFHTTDVYVYGQVEVSGHGTMELAGMGTGRILPGPGGGPSQLINEATIMANRPLRFGSSAANAVAITNRGTIVADDDLEFYMASGEEVVNEGSIQLTTADSRLFFRTGGAVIRNSGEINLVDPESRISVATYIQDGGMTKGAGSLVGNVQLNGGTLQLSGTLTGNLTTNTGVIEIGDPVGRFQLSTDFNQSASTTLKIDIGGTTPEAEYDVFDIQGFFAFLGGPLEVSLLDLGSGIFLPDSGDTFQVLQTFNSVSGAFTNVADGARLTTSDGLGSFVVNYGINSAYRFNNVVLSDFLFDPTADFDDDGDVDQSDLAAWAAAYGLNSLADTNDDGDSDGHDFLTWQRQFGISPPALAAATVPEPRTALLLMLCTTILLSKRHAKSLRGSQLWRTASRPLAPVDCQRRS